jgi:hypothetical protein
VIVSRLLKSGVTIAGSGTCENFSMSPLSFTSATGPVHNPWLRGWTTGGSSSGPSALVGLRQMQVWRKRHGLPSLEEELGEGVEMAIGGDQGGSIRIPAAWVPILISLESRTLNLVKLLWNIWPEAYPRPDSVYGHHVLTPYDRPHRASRDKSRRHMHASLSPRRLRWN